MCLDRVGTEFILFGRATTDDVHDLRHVDRLLGSCSRFVSRVKYSGDHHHHQKTRMTTKNVLSNTTGAYYIFTWCRSPLVEIGLFGS